MAKKDMARPEWPEDPKNDVSPVPEFQEKAGQRKKAALIIEGTEGPSVKGLHEKPIPGVYAAIDTDLARDNLENDIPAADLEDL